MIQNYIRVANKEDEQLLQAYFREALHHYEEQGELLAMQDIKYFLENMYKMRFYVMEETTLQITYAFEIPGLGGEVDQGQLTIPFQNN